MKNMRNLMQAQLTTYGIIESSCTFPRCSNIDHILMEKENDVVYLSNKNKELEKSNETLKQRNKHLEARIIMLNHELFGTSSEKNVDIHKEEDLSKDALDNDDINSAQDKTLPHKKRGARPGHIGRGRTIPDLPEVEVIHEIPEDESKCATCGLPFKDTSLTEDSYEIDYEVKIVRKKHIRKRSVKVCNCHGPRFKTAAKEPQVIPKSKFSNNFWAGLLTSKYYFQIPLNRIIMMLSTHGLSLSAGTITGGLKVLLQVLLPLYNLLLEISQSEKHWHIDETGWMNFVHIPDKKGYNWWMWVFVSPKTSLFILDSRRSSQVPYEHLGQDAQGVVNSDRYSAYKKLSRMVGGLVKAFCWAHFRRDFIKAGKSVPTLKPWADKWVNSIANVYKLNKERLAVLGDQLRFAKAQAKLESAIDDMACKYDTELKSPKLDAIQYKILKSAQNHWEELTTFTRHTHIPMDNNLAERKLRPVALGRKNYYGSHALWSGNLAAVCMSIFQTASMHGLSGEHYLRYYFNEYSKKGRPPDDLKAFLPWNISDEIIKEYSMRPAGLAL